MNSYESRRNPSDIAILEKSIPYFKLYCRDIVIKKSIALLQNRQIKGLKYQENMLTQVKVPYV